ncbi:MAG TPA: ATP-binding protein, partial [Acidimicrobiales bacterium]|nr:ATP-binding protein [Acidimicrobiales bacterium]
GDLPVWAPCLYDTRLAPSEVLERAVSRHRHIVDRSGGIRVNQAFRSVRSLAEFLPPPDDPLERTKPSFEVVGPTPANVRTVLRAVCGVLEDVQREDLLVAVSEAVTNAHVHGLPPVTVRMWVGEHRVVVRVLDGGRGPSDPLAGLLPVRGDGAESGRGLWLAHQLDVDVALMPSSDGFTVRFRAGRTRDRGPTDGVPLQHTPAPRR